MAGTQLLVANVGAFAAPLSLTHRDQVYFIFIVPFDF